MATSPGTALSDPAPSRPMHLEQVENLLKLQKWSHKRRCGRWTTSTC